jgi:hypothetical protein
VRCRRSNETQQEATAVSDDMNMQPSGAGAPNAEAPGTKPGLFATPGGRIIGIVVGLGALAIVIGIVAAIALFVLGDSGTDKFVTQPGGAGQETTSTAGGGGQPTTAPPAAVAAPAPEVSNREVFTFRDIFEPLLKPLPAETETTTTDTDGTTTGNETPTSAGTLYLDDIVTEDGVLKAQLRLDGEAYTLAAGEAIPDTPWKVLRVSSTQVTMLYGDTQVVLTIGQGITK